MLIFMFFSSVFVFTLKVVDGEKDDKEKGRVYRTEKKKE